MSQTLSVEDPKNIADLIEELREIVKVKNLDCPTDDSYLIRSLRCTHFVVKQAYKQIKNYVQLQKDYPECFSDWTTEFIDRMAADNMATVYKEKALDGSRILYAKVANWDPDRWKIMPDIGRGLMWSCTVMSHLEDVQKNGLHLVVDLENYTFFQMRSFGFENARLVMHLVQNCTPVFIRTVHFINEGYVSSLLLNILKKLANTKVKEMAFFHGRNYEKLHELMPKEMLPSDAGGTTGIFKMDPWAHGIVRASCNADWINQEIL